MRKAKAPEWMVRALEEALLDVDVVLPGAQDQIVADAICQAIQDNPQVVTGKDLDDCLTAGEHMSTRHHQLQASLGYFQKHVLFRSEPEVPEEVTKLVDILFTNGAAEEADHLVLKSSDGRNLGGWCKQAVRDQILEAWRGKASK